MDPSKLKLKTPETSDTETKEIKVEAKDVCMLSTETIELLNYRIQQEQFSSRIYEVFALWLENESLTNLASLYEKYTQEELIHANWAKEYLLSYDIKPTLKPLDNPEATLSFSSIQNILDLTLQHEKDISNQCNALATYALKNGDHMLYALGSKYCKEQAEELNKAFTLLSAYRRTSDDLVFDHYVGDLG